MQRVKYLDISKGFALMLMILGHCGLPIPYLGTIISTFHMPLFFIACGYLTSENSSFNISRKFNKIIIPYIFIFVLSIIPYYVIYKNWDILWIFPLMKTRMLFGIDTPIGIGPVWFLPCYFMSNLLVSHFSRKCSLNKLIFVVFWVFTFIYIISILVHGLPFLLYQTTLGTLFILIGFHCKERDYIHNTKFVIIGLMSTLICIMFGGFSMYSVMCNLWILQIVAAVFCTLLIFELSKKIVSFKPLEWLSKNSLSILCIHTLDCNFKISSDIREMLGLSIYTQFFFFCFFIAFGLLIYRVILVLKKRVHLK